MIPHPLVSVIIPTCNNIQVVCDAIDCAFGQTYKNLEIIVIDDGSTDGTGQLLADKYGGLIKYVYQENRGPSGSRNTGLRCASGKYIQFLDADDLLDQDKIGIQVKVLENISDIGLAYCDYICCDINDIQIILEGRISPVLQKENPFEDLMMKWETDLTIPIHSFLFDSVFFKELGISFDESLPNHVDWDCWMTIFSLNPAIRFIDKPLAIYRIRNDSLCRNRTRMREGYLSAIDKQILKHKSDREIIKKLKMRKKQIRSFYRDVSPLMNAMEKYHPAVKKIYGRMVPGRIQRIFY
jgi:glycosyltransferase involved in cell wall biosynthesis